MAPTSAIAGASPTGSVRVAPSWTRNNWVGLPIHRVDMKLAWPIPAGAYEIEASVEIFNVFNHANFYTYVTNESSPSYGNPRQSFLVAYVPRTAALGMKVSF